jgi:hypothetical protein
MFIWLLLCLSYVYSHTNSYSYTDTYSDSCACAYSVAWVVYECCVFAVVGFWVFAVVVGVDA